MFESKIIFIDYKNTISHLIIENAEPESAVRLHELYDGRFLAPHGDTTERLHAPTFVLRLNPRLRDKLRNFFIFLEVHRGLGRARGRSVRPPSNHDADIPREVLQNADHLHVIQTVNFFTIYLKWKDAKCHLERDSNPGPSIMEVPIKAQIFVAHL